MNLVSKVQQLGLELCPDHAGVHTQDLRALRSLVHDLGVALTSGGVSLSEDAACSVFQRFGSELRPAVEVHFLRSRRAHPLLGDVVVLPPVLHPVDLGASPSHLAIPSGQGLGNEVKELVDLLLAVPARTEPTRRELHGADVLWCQVTSSVVGHHASSTAALVEFEARVAASIIWAAICW